MSQGRIYGPVSYHTPGRVWPRERLREPFPDRRGRFVPVPSNLPPPPVPPVPVPLGLPACWPPPKRAEVLFSPPDVLPLTAEAPPARMSEADSPPGRADEPAVQTPARVDAPDVPPGRTDESQPGQPGRVDECR